MTSLEGAGAFGRAAEEGESAARPRPGPAMGMQAWA